MDDQKQSTAPATWEPEGRSDFEKQASEGNAGLMREVWLLILHNKKWWLAPIIIVLLLIGLLVILGSTAAAPFIYQLF